MPRAGLALGSNLGDRLAHLHRAIAGLHHLAVPATPVLIAPVYQTSPCNCPPGSPDFYNTAIEIDFAGSPLELLDETRALERALGRLPNPLPNAPRIIDIDLLYLGDHCCQDAQLVLPHPRMTQRRFVLQPLADIRPDLVLPGQCLTVAALLNALPHEPALTRVKESAGLTSIEQNPR